MKLQFFHIIGLIAIFQSLFLALVFSSGFKDQVKGNRLLSILLVVFAVLIGSSFTHTAGIDYFRDYNKIIFIIGQTGFLIGPLLYFYFKSILENNFSFKKKDIYHLLPLGTAVCFFSSQIFRMPDASPWLIQFNFLYSIGLLLQQLAYLIFILLLLREHNIAFKDLLSRVDDPKKIWLRIFIIGYILLWNIKLQSFILLDVYNRWGFCPYGESMNFLTMFLLVNTILYVALKRPEIFHIRKKYISSELSRTDIERYRAKLVKLMEKEKPYLEPSLTMPALAKRLSMPTRHLSQVINESCNKNFCDFINEYRIMEIRKVFLDQANGYKSILEIAYEVGFNSKSAFNRAFKKLTGLTPKDFKKNIQEEYKPDYIYSD